MILILHNNQNNPFFWHIGSGQSNILKRDFSRTDNIYKIKLTNSSKEKIRTNTQNSIENSVQIRTLKQKNPNKNPYTEKMMKIDKFLVCAYIY